MSRRELDRKRLLDRALDRMIRQKDVAESEAYLCGPQEMIQACIELLTALGMAPEKIFYDAFIQQKS